MSGRVLTLFVSLLVLTSAVAAVESVTVVRAVTIDISDDPNAVVALDTALSVTSLAGSINIDRLTTVTNNHGATVTVTITLRNDTAEKANLEMDGNTSTSEGDTATFTLDPGMSRDVSVRVQPGSSGDLFFGVTATASVFDYSAPDRKTTIVSA